MADETRIRVRLDTSQAKAEMDNLTRKGAATAKGLSAKVRQSVGSELGKFGSGALVGAAIGSVASGLKGSTTAGFGDLISEVTDPLGARLNDYLLGTADDEARARRSAREEVSQAFSSIIGQTGTIPPQVYTYFDHLSGIKLYEEKGKSLIASDPRLGGSETVAAAEQIGSSVGQNVAAAISSVFQSIFGSSSPK